MKQLILCLPFFILAFSAFAQSKQDIVLKTRFDLESSEALITQLRVFLLNNNFGDPYNQVLKKPITIDLADTLDDIPQDTQRWIRELQNILRLQLFESDYKVTFEKLGYQIVDFNSEFRPGTSSDARIEYVTLNYVKGVHLRADRILFRVELNRTQTREPIRFDIELIEPEFIVSPELTAQLNMGWSTSLLPENLRLTLESIDIRHIMQRISKNPQLIDLHVKDLVIPDVSIRVGNREVKFDREKIKKFFIQRKNDLKKGVLDLLNERMEERFGNVIKDNSKQLLLPKKFSFTSDLSGVLELQKMDVNKTGILQVDIGGSFDQVKSRVRRDINREAFERSMREINRHLIEKRTNVAVSIGEAYLNQIIEATIINGMWDDALKGKDFVLGPEKAFVLAEEKGDFSLYLDIFYKLKGSDRILVGRNELRFPVKLMIALKVEELHGLPHFTISVKKIATDHKILLEGLPQYGLPTTVDTVPRFRNKVLNRIMEEVSDFSEKVLMDFELKELKGTYFHHLEFSSDGMGRGNALIGFKQRTK